MRFSATLLSLMAVVMALPVANDERDLVVTQEQTVTTTWCPETAEGQTASPVEKVVTATVVTTIQSTDVVTAPCSKCEEEEKEHQTLQGVPSTPAPAPAAPPAATTPAPAPAAPAPPAPAPEKPAGVPEKPAAPAPAPVVTSAPAEAAPSTVWNVVTQYTTICPENYVPPPCDEQAAALSSVASAVGANKGNAVSAPLASVPDVPASVSIPDSLTAALASAINAASTYPVASASDGDDDVTYLDVTVTPTSTVNKTVTPTVTVGGSSSPSTTSGAPSTTSSSAPFQTGPGKTEATPAVSTDAASKKLVGNAPPTPGPTVSTASDFSASIASAASAAVDSALKELAFNA